MTSLPPPDPPAPRRGTGLGLRLRLWLACLAGGLVAGGGTLWVLGTQGPPVGATPALLGWLSGVAFAALAAGLLLALWLDHHVGGQLRGLLDGVHSGRASDLRGLPAASGWGELSELGEALQDVLSRQRASGRAGGELARLHEQLAALRAALERWQQSERWEAPPAGEGAAAEVAEVLGHALQRRAAVDEQNRDAARLVAREVGEALADAQESAGQAERGFVEATALLTTVRELQRLSLELGQALAAGGAAPAPAVDAAEAARGALAELVDASGDSVESLGRALLRVHEVGEQVQRLANRATLIAIQAITAEGRGEGGSSAEELKQLARDVREATDRTAQFALDVEGAVAEAGERMRAARERALARLGERAAPATAAERAPEDARRLLERVREMVQDAARKGERLSAAGERASRAAERLAKRLDAGAAETEALAVRLSPVGEPPDAGAGDPPPLGLHVFEHPGEAGQGEPDRRGEERS